MSQIKNRRYQMRTATEALPLILRDLLRDGSEVGSRNGRVMEFLNAQIVLTEPMKREILSLNRKANVFAQIAETMWVVSGRNDIEWLSAYLPRAKDYADDGLHWRAGYGPRIRDWNGVDQLRYVVDTLKADPLSRQAVIAIWDPVVDTTPGKDKACNTFLQFQSREGRLHLTVNVRSNDVMWGWSGINSFEWSTLQEMVASMLGIWVGDLTFNVGSLHLYAPHWKKADTIRFEDLSYDTVPFNPDGAIATVDDLDGAIDQWFEWETICREGHATGAALEHIEDPLLKSWAAAIAWYWQRENHWLERLNDTALAVAVARTPVSVLSEAPQTSHSATAAPVPTRQRSEPVRAFYDFVANLHAVKHASYGDSWKKRGEQMSILANIARKVDRLGVGDEFDSSADTVIDLMVYLIKYGWWLQGVDDGPENVNTSLDLYLDKTAAVSTEGWALDITFADIQGDFNTYCDSIGDQRLEDKLRFVSDMLETVTPVARDLWYEEQQNKQIDKIHGPGAAAALDEAIKDGSIFNDTDEYRGADVD